MIKKQVFYTIFFILTISPIYSQWTKVKGSNFEISELSKNRISVDGLKLSLYKGDLRDTSLIIEVQMDTIIDSARTFHVGFVIKSSVGQGNKIGYWKSYYPNWNIKSEGNWNLSLFSWCGIGPILFSRNLKNGKWKYYHKNGSLMAIGKYMLLTGVTENNCTGGVNIVISESQKNWKFYNNTNTPIEINDEIDKIINGN